MSLNSNNERESGGGGGHTLQAPRLLPGGYSAWKPLMDVHLQRHGAEAVHTTVSTADEWVECNGMVTAASHQAQADAMGLLRAAAAAMAIASSSSSSTPPVLAATKAAVVSDEIKAARKLMAALVERSVRAYGTLYSALPEELRTQVAHLPQGWAHGLWNWLECKFQSTEEDSVDILIGEWAQLRQTDDESFDAYRARVNKLATLLEQAKEKPSARMYAYALLSKLQPLYAPAILALRAGSQLKDKAAISWESVTAFVNSHEREAHRLEEAASAASGAAMAVRHGGGSYAKTAARAPQQAGSSDSDRARTSYAPRARGQNLQDVQCYNCDQFGHMSNRCALPDRRLGSKQAPAAPSAPPATGTSGRSASGATGKPAGGASGKINSMEGNNRFEALSDDDVDIDQPDVAVRPDTLIRRPGVAIVPDVAIRSAADINESVDRRGDHRAALADEQPAEANAWGLTYAVIQVDESVCSAGIDIGDGTSSTARATRTTWGVDTMASSHVTGDRQQFAKLRTCAPVRMMVADGNIVTATQRGTVAVTVDTTDGRRVTFDIHNVYYHERFSANLLSWNVLRQRGWQMQSSLQDTVITMPGGNRIALATTGRVSVMESSQLDPQHVFAIGRMDLTDAAGLVRLHERLGHMGFDRMVAVIQKGTTLDLGKLNVAGPALAEARRRVMECVGCAQGKGQRTAFGHRGVDQGSAPGEVLHMDTYHVTLANGDQTWAEYGLVVTDPHSEYRWFSRLTSKDQGASRVIEIVRNAQTQCGCSVKRLFADGGSEFINHTVKKFCADSGIELHYPPARTQQLNGVAERGVRSSKDMARTMLLHAGTPGRYWWRAAHHAAYVWNRTAVATATGVTPFESMFGRKPSATSWGVFGCDAFCHVPKEQRQAFGAKMQPCIYLGHDHVQNCAIVHVMATSKTIACRDVQYRESSFTHGASLAQGPQAVEELASSHGGHEAALQGGREPHDNAEREYEVESIVGQRVRHGLTEYLVRWTGYDDAPTWEPASNLDGSTELISDYVRTHPVDGQHEPLDVEQVDEHEAQVDAPLAPVARGRWWGPRTRRVRVASPSAESESEIEQSDAAAAASVEPVDLDARLPSALAEPISIPPREPSRRLRGHVPELAEPDWGMSVMELCVDQLLCAVSAGVGLLDQQTPANYHQAIGGRHGDPIRWRGAMDTEMASCAGLGAWEYVRRVDVPGANILPVKWVYKIKTDEFGGNHVYKARITPKGFRQKHGKDYFEVYAATGMYKTMRVGLSLAAKWDHELEQMDVPTAFLNATVEEDVYMEVPEGYRDGREGMVCVLRKALYGLKQAPRNWYRLISSFIQDDMGFRACVSDPCLFFKRSATERLMLLFLFVDDMQISFHRDDRVEWTAAKQLLVDRFHTKDMGPSTWILGMRIVYDRVARTITLDQELYVTKALERFGLSACKVAPTPGVAGRDGPSDAHIGAADGSAPDASLDLPADRDRFMEIVGTLIYGTVGVKIDCAHAAYALACCMQAPTRRDMVAAERLLRYWAGTADVGLIFGSRNGPVAGDSRVGHPQSDVQACVYADADWANSKINRRSISGYVAKLNGDPVSWHSKRQRVVALSTCEAELYAEAAAVQEILWMRGLMQELGLDTSVGSVVYGDNQSALAVSVNGIKGERTKHVDIKYHFVTETVARGDVRLEWIPTKEMQADIFTKALAAPIFLQHRAKLMTC